MSDPELQLTPDIKRPELSSPKGVRGMLMLFCLTGIILGPLLSLLSLGLVGANATTLFNLLFSLFGACVGLYLIAVGRYAQLLAFIFLLTVMILGIWNLVWFYGLDTGDQYDNRAVEGHSWRNIWYAVFWICYFIVSSRVRNTFGSNIPVFRNRQSTKQP